MRSITGLTSWLVQSQALKEVRLKEAPSVRLRWKRYLSPSIFSLRCTMASASSPLTKSSRMNTRGESLTLRSVTVGPPSRSCTCCSWPSSTNGYWNSVPSSTR